ncbi:MAG: hypothetical protein AB1349_14165, partial [Elusimicrobiota bacterium]
GKAEGKIEMICKFLGCKFGLKALKLQKKAQKITDLTILDDITGQIFLSESLQAIEKIIKEALDVQESMKEK